MKAPIKAVGLVALACVLAAAAGCDMEKKVIELMVTGETCAGFEEDHASGDFSSESVLAYGDELQEILEDNDIDRSDIARAFVVGGSYEVTEFSHTHDWTVGGAVLVERMGLKAEPDTLLRYTSQLLTEALDNQIWAELHPDGVQVLNTALEDFLEGQQPVLKFTVENGTTTPEPSSSDRIVFDWETCIRMQFIYSEEFEFPEL